MQKITSFLTTTAVALLAAGCEPTGDSAHDHRSQVAASISLERLAGIEKQLRREVDAGVRAGFVAMVAHHADIVYTTAVGMADRENAIAMTLETRFRIASMTKPITTAAVMILVERGEVLLSDPVSRFIPEFADLHVATSHTADASGGIPTEALSRPITIHHLLTHTSGLGYVFDTDTDLGRLLLENNLYWASGGLAERIQALANWPLYAQPGSEWRYSSATDVAGRVVEVASGMTLETFMQENIFEPLGMSATEFFLDGSDFAGLAVVYGFDDNGNMSPFTDGDGRTNGLVGANPNTEAMGWMSGGGGLVSTAGDYMRFLMMLLNEGELDGVRILSPTTVRLILAEHVSPEALPEIFSGSGWTFGLGGQVLLAPGLAARLAAEGEYVWGGYYNTFFSISPADELAVVVMAQAEQGLSRPESRATGIVRAIALGALED